MIGNVYGVEQISTHRWYIGQTRRGMETRWHEHQYCATHGIPGLLYDAMRETGISDFRCILLKECDTQEELFHWETHYIRFYDSVNDGFNISEGPGILGCKRSEEFKEKIRKVHLGKKFTDEHRKHLSEACIGKRMGEANGFFRKKHTEEFLEFIREHNHKFSIEQYSLDGNLIRTYYSINEAAAYIWRTERWTTKLSSVQQRIGFAARGNAGTKTAYGYIWKLIDKSVTTSSKEHRAEDELLLEVPDNQDKG